MGNVIFGLAVVVVVVVRIVVVVAGACVGGNAMPDMDEETDGRGFGTVRLEHASIKARQLNNSSSSKMRIFNVSNTLVVVLVECICRFLSIWLQLCLVSLKILQYYFAYKQIN